MSGVPDPRGPGVVRVCPRGARPPVPAAGRQLRQPLPALQAAGVVQVSGGGQGSAYCVVVCSREQIDNIDTRPPVPISLEQIKQKAGIENEYFQPGILIPDAFQHVN